jgi:RNA polymerase sigma-70 factor (ECF subfamily)
MSLRHDEAGRIGAIGIEYLDGLYSYALVLTGNPAEAEGLVEEAYVHALGAMGQPRLCGNLKGWLFTILRSSWFNQLRESRNDPQMVEAETPDRTANCAVKPSTGSHDLYVSTVESEDFSYQEIAWVLEDSVGIVMSRLARARAKLREMLSAAAARAIHLE